MNIIQKINICALLWLSMMSAKAQTTYEEMEQLTVNDQVTTVITASEPIRFVDISTDKVVGDQPINQLLFFIPGFYLSMVRATRLELARSPIRF